MVRKRALPAREVDALREGSTPDSPISAEGWGKRPFRSRPYCRCLVSFCRRPKLAIRSAPWERQSEAVSGFLGAINIRRRQIYSRSELGASSGKTMPARDYSLLNGCRRNRLR
jgi:hypothetical protein